MSIHGSTLRGIGIAATLAVGFTVGVTGCAGGSDAKPLSSEDSPLARLLGPLSGPTDKKAMREKEREVQNLVARCMSDAGFEYKPSDQAATVFGPEDLAKQETEEWISKNGYGYTSSGENESDSVTDPNATYVESLSPAQQDAYYQALYGEQQSTDGPGSDVGVDPGSTTYDPATAGCTDRSYRQANGGKGNFWEDKKYSKLLESMSEVHEKTDKVPEVKAAAAKWSDCMAEAGYSGLSVKMDAREHVSTKLESLYGAGEDSGAVSEPSAEDKKKLHDLEIKIALADFRCDKKNDYSTTQLKAGFELEKTFISEHRAELDELIDAYRDNK